MDKLQNIKKRSAVIGKIAGGCKIFCGVMTVLLAGCAGALFFLRNILNPLMLESGQTFDYDFSSWGFIENMLDHGKFAEGVSVYLLGMAVIIFILTVIMHHIAKIFKAFNKSYSPFLPEVVGNMKIAAVLITLLSLQSSLLIGAVIGLVLWGVLEIYAYGCELQNQSDETL